MTIALSYSGKWDITQACRHIALQVKQGLLDPETIDENLFASYLSTASMPDPDLLIRTSGEYRISNFMLWQNAYSKSFSVTPFGPISGATNCMKPSGSFKTRTAVWQNQRATEDQ